MATGIAAANHSGVDATIFDRLEAIVGMDDAALARGIEDVSGELLRIGETALEAWLASRDETPTQGVVEGFRLLALHRQGARGVPSFNACRETCRELVYQTNCARLTADAGEATRHLRLAAMVTRHLLLFVDGKLESAGMGEFCCSSKTLRSKDAVMAASANT